ncbi:hypothetical protein PSTA9_04909 [Pseudomonas syringae pv. tomato]|nr:hypothetical protein PSTA9_04909 [Pseudomonas syringae pv. tomato]
MVGRGSNTRAPTHYMILSTPSKAQVESLLGSPTECSGALGMSSCTWGDQNTFISVQYAADKVVLFSGQGLK